MSKITPEHLARQAVVYIRQSTADQVANNLGSKHVLRTMVDLAHQQLGLHFMALVLERS